MGDIAQANAAAYAARYQLRLVERLGSGIHGTVHVAEHAGKQDQSAITAHNSVAPYKREREVYGRLRNASVTAVLGLHVPQFIRADDELLVIEMTIVTRPFVLDFASAQLGTRPPFPEELWAEWESEKREQFGTRWKTVQAVMNALEELGIFLGDVSPSNIAFAD